MEWAKEVFNYLATTGTNDIVISLVLKNIIILGILVKITPWTWDNDLLKGFRDRWGKSESHRLPTKNDE